MANHEAMKTAIQNLITEMMDRVMRRVLVEDPFIKEKHHAGKPLYAALVPDEIFRGSHFERRFVTPFGSAWEKLAIVAAEYGLGRGLQGYNVTGNVREGRLRRIQEVLDRLEHPQKGKKFTFELKAPLPNSDQTKVSKEKLLKLYCMEPRQVDEAYYALPYNPYGQRENYSWGFPKRWFNMKEDKVVLIGDEFWEKIGGIGTYQSFISAVNEIGLNYKERIYREFLGIEPPSDFGKVTL